MNKPIPIIRIGHHWTKFRDMPAVKKIIQDPPMKNPIDLSNDPDSRYFDNPFRISSAPIPEGMIGHIVVKSMIFDCTNRNTIPIKIIIAPPMSFPSSDSFVNSSLLYSCAISFTMPQSQVMNINQMMNQLGIFSIDQ